LLVILNRFASKVVRFESSYILWAFVMLFCWSCGAESNCGNCENGSKREIKEFNIAIPKDYNYKIYYREKVLVFSDTSDIKNVIGVVQIFDGVNDLDSIYKGDLLNFMDDPTFKIINHKNYSQSIYFLEYANFQETDTFYSERYYKKADENIIVSEISSSYSTPKKSPEYCSVFCSLIDE